MLAHDEIAASVPERHYDLAGQLLAAAVAESGRTGSDVRICLQAAAMSAGRAMGARVDIAGTRGTGHPRETIVTVLAESGYEPTVVGEEVALTNCPFHRLAQQERDLVCGMNLDLLTGVLEGAGPVDGLRARLAPEPGYCCVRIGAA